MRQPAVWAALDCPHDRRSVLAMSEAEYPTDEDIARTQQAISEAYDEWVAEVEDAVDYRPPEGGGPTEVPVFSELMSATPEQLADLNRRLGEAKLEARTRTLAGMGIAADARQAAAYWRLLADVKSAIDRPSDLEGPAPACTRRRSGRRRPA